jgi:hypothetical protein
VEEVGGVILTSLLLDHASPRVHPFTGRSPGAFPYFLQRIIVIFGCKKGRKNPRKKKRNLESKGAVDQPSGCPPPPPHPRVGLGNKAQKWMGG